MTTQAAAAGTSKKKPPSASDDDPLPPPGPVTMCNRCLAVLGPGFPHPQPCGLVNFRENITKLLSRDTRSLEIVASDVIRQKFGEPSSDAETISLATRGRNPFPVAKPSRESQALYKNKPVPAEEFARMCQVTGLKVRQREEVASFNRSWFGKPALESGLKRKLREKDTALEPFFKLSKRDMDSSLKGEKEEGKKDGKKFP